MTTSERIIKNIVGLDEWCEKNKLKFLKKNNPKLYKEIKNLSTNIKKQNELQN